MTNTEKILQKEAPKLYAWFLFYKELYSEKGEEEAKELARLEVLDMARVKVQKRTKRVMSSSELWEALEKYCPEVVA